MSGRETPPQFGANLLAAVAASLAALRAHLTDPDPKVSLRASAELTKLLSACARYEIELTSRNHEGAVSGEGEAPAEPGLIRAGSVSDGLPSDLVAPASEPVEVAPAAVPIVEPVPPEQTPAPWRSRLVDDARPRPRRAPFHESHARRDPPAEPARPPSAIPA